MSVRLHDFYAPNTTVHVQLPLAWPDFVRSTATVGRDVTWTSAVADRYLRHERAWRTAMIYSCLRASSGSQTARPLRTSAYKTLDRSEKGAISFFLGQATAKYVAETLFGCVVFAHVDSAMRILGLPVQGSRPDFIGLCSDGRALVVECKGRSAGVGSVLQSAKNQVSQLPTAPGVSELRYAHASYFAADELQVAMLDPDGESDVEVPVGALLLAYFRPLVSLLTTGDDIVVGSRRYAWQFRWRGGVSPFRALVVEVR